VLLFFALDSKKESMKTLSQCTDYSVLQSSSTKEYTRGKEMAAETRPTQEAEATERKKQSGPLELVHTVEKDIKPAQAFFTKFNNDWVMNLAAGLSFNILTAIFPIVIAIISVAGLVIDQLNPSAKTQLISGISSIFPSTLFSNGQNVLAPALLSLSKNAGLLGVIAVLMAIFGGSRLFVTLEGYFDIIYHTRPRTFIKQNIMACIMLLLFIVLVPLMVFAGSGPALVFSLLKATPFGQIPGVNLLFGLGGLLVGLILAWIFFMVIYVVVPNQHISLRNSWLGALVAAILVQLYLTLFPFYVTHFLNSYTGSAGAAGFAIILLFFLYYFSVILLLGAEINAFFAEKIRATPADIPTMIHNLTSHLSTNEQTVQEQAAVSHKGEEPKKSVSAHEAQQQNLQANDRPSAPGKQQAPQQTRDAQANDHGKKKKKSSRQKASRLLIVEAVAGTTLAFFVEFFRLRRKK
jgi:membrane protein